MYKIVRIYYPDKYKHDSWGEPIHKKSRTIKTGLTLEQAQSHCSNPAARLEEVYFDTYKEI